jgi:hypothetical protein
MSERKLDLSSAVSTEKFLEMNKVSRIGQFTNKSGGVYFAAIDKQNNVIAEDGQVHALAAGGQSLKAEGAEDKAVMFAKAVGVTPTLWVGYIPGEGIKVDRILE